MRCSERLMIVVPMSGEWRCTPCSILFSIRYGSMMMPMPIADGRFAYCYCFCTISQYALALCSLSVHRNLPGGSESDVQTQLNLPLGSSWKRDQSTTYRRRLIFQVEATDRENERENNASYCNTILNRQKY